MNGKCLLRLFGAVTCILFICSVFCPFLQVQLFVVTFTGYPGPETFWSFKVTAVYFRTPDSPGAPIIKEYWFADYWTKYINYRTIDFGLGIGPVFVVIFGAQVLTILFAALAILKVRSHSFLSAAILNVSITFCMWLTSRAFIYPYYKYAFETGFWLTSASATLFLAAAISVWRWLGKKRAQV